MVIPFLRRAESALTQEPELLTLGHTTFRGATRRFGLLPADRLRHLHVLGKTGVGKSTLLANLMLQDLTAGRGFALIDPHGDLAQVVLERVPRRRQSDLVMVEPGGPITLNPFRLGTREHPDRMRLASALIAIFHALWADSWGPRLEHVLRAGILAVSYHPEASLTLLSRFLSDEEVRSRVLERTADPIVRAFWEVEFAAYGARLQAEALAPVQNKLGAIVMHPGLRALVAGVRSRFDPEAAIASRRVVLVTAPASELGDDGSRLLGALVFSFMQLAAWQRPAGPDGLFTVYADEVQRFVTGTFATTLSEARKYGLAVVLAHQYLDQLPPAVRTAVLGNVGSQAIFRVGGADAAELAVELAPHAYPEHLTSLDRSHAVMRLIARGVPLDPVFAETLPLPPPVAPAA